MAKLKGTFPSYQQQSVCRTADNAKCCMQWPKRPHHVAEYEANTEWHQSCIHHKLRAVMGHTFEFLAAFLSIADMQLQSRYHPHTPYGKRQG